MKVKLGSFLKIIQGYAFKTKNYVKSGKYRLVTLGNFEEGGNCFKYNNEKAVYYGADFPSKTILKEGDLILPLTEQVVGLFGNSAFVPRENRFQFVLNQRVGKVVLVNDRIDIKFLHYLLATSRIKKQLEARANGTKQRNISPDDIYDVEVDLPSINIQKNIGNLFYNIENKQKINTQINSQLEELAKTIYDYWFFQFEFPNEQGKPYKSSGGKMVYNEQLKREIPEGWEVVNIRDICSVTWGQCPDGENILSSNYNGNDAILYCSGAGDMRNGLLVDCQAKTNASRRYAHKNDILMSVAGSIGAMAICNNKISLGRAAAAFTPKENRLLYSYLTISKFISRMKDVSSGSIQKVVNDSHLNEMNIPYCKEIVNKFAIFNILINMEIKNEEQNKELSSLRDFLLPLLMNGQVTFKE